MIVDGGRGKMKWRGVGFDPRLHLELKWRVRADRRGGGDGGARRRRCELGVGAGGGGDGCGVVKRRRGAFYRRARSVEGRARRRAATRALCSTGGASTAGGVCVRATR